METEVTQRKAIARSKIFDYWKDKAITVDGNVIHDDDHYHEDSIPAIEYFEEPVCWACGKHVKGVYETKRYDEYIKQRKFAQLYNIGSEARRLERCHIVPHMLGGSDTDPSNMFLLCHQCHEESPDTSNPSAFLRWVYVKRHRIYSDDGRDLTSLVEGVIKECDAQGKDFATGDSSKLQITNHGQKISDASIVYGYVATCKPKEDTT